MSVTHPTCVSCKRLGESRSVSRHTPRLRSTVSRLRPVPSADSVGKETLPGTPRDPRQNVVSNGNRSALPPKIEGHHLESGVYRLTGGIRRPVGPRPDLSSASPFSLHTNGVIHPLSTLGGPRRSGAYKGRDGVV